MKHLTSDEITKFAKEQLEGVRENSNFSVTTKENVLFGIYLIWRGLVGSASDDILMDEMLALTKIETTNEQKCSD